MKCAPFLTFYVILVYLQVDGASDGSVLKKQKYQINQELNVPCNVSMCTGPLSGIYCHGPILTNAWLFGLEKSCPGNKLRFPAENVIANFHKLLYPIKKLDFQTFCEENFEPRPYLEAVELKDWVPSPKFIEEISNPNHKKLSQEVHNRWNRLARQFTLDVKKNPDLYPLLPVENPFIVPGGRFDVYFYWDTYWIIKGLLVSEMFDTARGIIQNFADLIDKLGYIPNSGNLQLTRRSQPPLFAHMVWEYTKVTGKYEKDWMQKMEREMEFWEKNRTIHLKDHTFFIYNTSTNCPRPENFLADYNLGIRTANPSEVWRSISSACESGWDFSSRWMYQNSLDDLSGLHTDKIVPVDLNVMIAMNYKYLAFYAEHFGRFDKFGEHQEKYQKLTDAIDSVLWDQDHGAWFDYDLLQNRKNFNFYPSNVYPLMIPDFVKRSDDVERFIKSTGVLEFRGGIPSSLPAQSTQQWDFPNVWAPNQHFVIQSFLASSNRFLRQEARRQAEAFIESVFNGLYTAPEGAQGSIWEKYDARSNAGAPGAGGEYVVQEGFGWTNGAILDLIWIFRDPTRVDKNGEVSLNNSEQSALVYAAATFCVILAIVAIAKGVICRKRQQEEDREAQENLLASQAEDDES